MPFYTFQYLYLSKPALSIICIDILLRTANALGSG